jgi:hypothetical protein
LIGDDLDCTAQSEHQLTPIVFMIVNLVGF